MNASFEKLIQRNGTYSLPWLICLHDSGNNIVMRFVNNTSDIVYDENTYKAGAFSYTPNASENGFDGGGKLEIAVKDNQVIDLIETYSSVYLDVVGVMDSAGTITELKTFKHHYGKVQAERTKATFTFDKDDRLSMTFPTLIWTTQNNRGNS